MARRQYTQSLYDQLVAAFREKPGNSSAAARQCNVDQRTASRAWNKGWPSRSWAPPIKQYLEEEHEKVRAARQAALEERIAVDERQREQARADAIEAQKQEAVASQSARVNAIALNNMLSRILGPFISIADNLAKDMKEGKHPISNPAQMIAYMKTLSYIVRQANESSRLALEIERLRVGDPTEIFKVETTDMTMEEVTTHLMGIGRTLERARNHSMIKPNQELIDAGNGHYPPNTEFDPGGAMH